MKFIDWWCSSEDDGGDSGSERNNIIIINVVIAINIDSLNKRIKNSFDDELFVNTISDSYGNVVAFVYKINLTKENKLFNKCIITDIYLLKSKQNLKIVYSLPVSWKE